MKALAKLRSFLPLPGLKPAERNAAIDMARGIAILAVIAGHSIKGGSPIFWFIYLWHMPVFFVLSGRLFSTKDSFPVFARRKAQSLLLPYGVTFVFMSIYCLAIAPLMVSPGPTLHGVIVYLIKGPLYASGSVVPHLENMIQPIGPLWFLPCLFCATLIFYLSVKAAKHVPLIVSSVLCCCVGLIVPQYLFLPWSLDIALVAQIFLLFGYAWKNDPKRFAATWLNMALALAAFIMALTFTKFFMNDRVYPQFFLSACGSMAGVALVIWIAQALERYGWIRQSLSYLGRAALIILCFHQWDIWGGVAAQTAWYGAVKENFLLFFGMRLAISVLMYEMIRRSFLKHAFRLA